ncbi:MAG: (2Fe-2S)-binding protein [Acidimicrobiia bacterium]
MSALIVEFTLNGSPATARVMSSGSALDALRDELGLFGAKSGCEQGECGSCSILLDGAVVCSCLVMAGDLQGLVVVTVEGVAGDEIHPVQTAMHEGGAVQCGFCTPGIVVAAVDLFERIPHPTGEEIKEALAGNICRCTGYGAIVRALQELSAGSGT